MKVLMQNEKIAVEKLGKHVNKNSLFTVVDDVFSTGLIKYTHDNSKFKIGQKIIFGVQREPTRIEGVELLVMHDSNVIAILEESNEEKVQKQEGQI